MTTVMFKGKTPWAALSATVRIGSLAGALLFAAGTSASAQGACGNRADFVTQLGNRYAEAPIALCLTGNGDLVQVFAAANGATWTITVTRPDGLSCMITEGESWENLSPSQPKVANKEGGA